MSIFMKIFILIILFISLNIVSIYTFDYKDYFTNSKERIELNDKEGIFKFFSEEFFKKAGYISSEFTIQKIDNQLVLSGTFSSNKIAKQVTDFLKINSIKDVNIVENSQVSKDLLEQIVELTAILKDNFEDNSKISFINNTIVLEGLLKSEAYKELVDITTRKISGFEISTNISEKVKEIDLNQESVTKNEDFERIEQNPEEKETILSKDDIQLLVNNIFITDKISFERRSVEPTPKSKILIEKLSKILKENSKFSIEIGGHTDSRGNIELNKTISQNRANKVKEILESFGVDKDRIKAVGYGNERPIAQDDENGLSEINRRVEFIIGD
ncbi:OmpA family protein [Aliarcobacter cryaerophilus]|uniref:OmpA family protein n=1 Tax=Aliarcobacter cryaerophilus TaxID=28198 RepID=UPI003DA6C3A5